MEVEGGEACHFKDSATKEQKTQLLGSAPIHSNSPFTSYGFLICKAGMSRPHFSLTG
jgi:hypothetical protein